LARHVCLSGIDRWYSRRGHLFRLLQLFVAKKQSLNWEKGSCRVRCYKASGPMVGFDPSPCPTDAVLPSRHLLQSYGKETIYFDGWPDLFIFIFYYP
jgi:hypothetical protein